MVDKLNIQSEMQAFDRKDRGFYNSLTDEEQRKFSPFMMIRWGSSVQGSNELEEYYVIATNERLNKRFFSVNTARHKKLQWLLATSVSPGLGSHKHVWIAPKKKQTSKKRKAIESMYPMANDDELDLLCEIVTDSDIKRYQQRSGLDQ